jgi:hypothetical protein
LAVRANRSRLPKAVLWVLEDSMKFRGFELTWWAAGGRMKVSTSVIGSPRVWVFYFQRASSVQGKWLTILD